MANHRPSQNWDQWHHDSFDLDAESPLAMSRSLWEDLTHSDLDVKDLFACTPASEIKETRPAEPSFEKDTAELSSSGQQMREDSPRLKRRRMLQFPGQQGDPDSCNPTMEPATEAIENLSDAYIGGYGDYQMQEPPATGSLWYVANDESLSSDEVEQSAECWMARCFGDREVETSQDLAENWTGAARCVDEIDIEALQNEMNIDLTSNASPEGSQAGFGEVAGGSSILQLPRPAMAGGRKLLKLATPVAYPFAVVKPSGMQGDVTLNDINQRIMMPRSRPVPHLRSSTVGLDARIATGGAANLSGRSVVALTKIHTEGKGTITIVRTKN